MKLCKICLKVNVDRVIGSLEFNKLIQIQKKSENYLYDYGFDSFICFISVYLRKNMKLQAITRIGMALKDFSALSSTSVILFSLQKNRKDNL